MKDAIAGAQYGLLALALAFVALPLYVQLSNISAREHAVPLGALGIVLSAARLVDACLDPWIGRGCDFILRGGASRLRRLAWAPAAVMLAGFAMLVLPPPLDGAALLAWIAAWLIVTCAGYSALSIAHQGWGALIDGGDTRRGRIFAWREGLALVGVLLALGLPPVAGWPATAAVLAALLAAGCVAWQAAGLPLRAVGRAGGAWSAPLADPRFRRLLCVFVVNGVASAIPATLVLFFIQDRLAAAPGWQPVLLAVYFAAGAVAMPLWAKCIDRWGLARSWFAGMLVAVAGFAFAGALGNGDAMAFIAVCALSGAALGSDLAIPQAMLARVVAASANDAAGSYFGWWNLATKANLALAAGVSLPLLAALGYVPGARSAQAMHALSLAYVAVPAALKLAACALLYSSFIRRERSP